MTTSAGIESTLEHAVQYITFYNHPSKNSLTRELEADLRAALDEASASPHVRAIVLRGGGGDFCSGGALQAGDGQDRSSAYVRYEGKIDRQELHAAIRNSPKPVIASVDGVCYGGGLMLAAQCDLRIASSRARFSLIEARIGSSGASVLPFLIGGQWTRYLLFTGDYIDAYKARDIGLLLDVCALEELDLRTAALAERITAMPVAGLRANKLAVAAAEEAMGWEVNRQLQLALASITDAAAQNAVSGDGLKFREVLRRDGFKAFKAARDAPYGEPWIAPTQGRS